MQIKKLKVRPQKNPPVVLCGPHLASMLGCWAATKDMRSLGPCQSHAQALYDCMRTAPMKRKQHQPAINYHLARLGKTLKD
ncbi:hypothetical protein BC834DRAFT_889629 [Gloeopeniophorella convolvens]|nr:hypothetical protein BC834DRAFT_889629 [Gloeopeniophorella convolvens]